MYKLINKYFYKIDLNKFKLGINCVIILDKKVDKVNSLGIILKKRFRSRVKRIVIGYFSKKNIIIMSYNLYSNNISKVMLNDIKVINNKRYSLYNSYLKNTL